MSSKVTNFFILLIFSFWGCNSPKESIVYFYFNNVSDTNNNVTLELSINGKKVKKYSLLFTNSDSDYKIFDTTLVYGEYEISVKKVNDTVSLTKKIIVTDSLTNIFISYNYHYPDSIEIVGRKKLHDTIYKNTKPFPLFNIDSLIGKEKIIIHKIDGKITIM
jgi:hypothetical protein